MNLSKIIVVSIVASSLGGCAFLSATSRSLGSSNGPQMLVWHPDYSAGVGRNTKLCVQGARTATAQSLNAAIDLASKAKGGLGYGEAVRALNPSNPQVTFASNGYFAICQLAINGYIDGSQVKELMRHVTENSLKVNVSASDNTALVSPTVVDAVTKLLGDNGIEVTPELEDEITEVVEEATGEDQDKTEKSEDEG